MLVVAFFFFCISRLLWMQSLLMAEIKRSLEFTPINSNEVKGISIGMSDTGLLLTWPVSQYQVL